MTHVPFKVEAVPAPPGSADHVAAAEAVLRNHFDQHASMKVTASATNALPESVLVDEELTVENVLAHLAWQRSSRPRDVMFRGLSDPWVLVITVSLTSLLTTFVSEAAKDAYLGCKRLFANLSRPRGEGSPIPVRVQDTDSPTELCVRSRSGRELPDQAWQELVAIRLEAPPQNCIRRTLVWNDTSSLIARARTLIETKEADGHISLDALLTVQGDADASEHDHWVLETEILLEPSQPSARPGRRWLRRPREAQDKPKSFTLERVWRAQERRWVLPR
jgi:hypothetical protein